MLDEIAFFIYLFSIIISVISLFFSLQKLNTRKGRRRRILSRWVKFNLETSPTVAIQAIRNLVLVNGAFISGLLVLTGLFIGLYDRIFPISEQFLWNLLPNLSLGLVQLIMIIIMIFLALIFFINSNRMGISLSFLISSKADLEQQEQTEDIHLIQRTFKTTQRSWIFGIRSLFYLMIIISWIVNTILFICVTVLITFYIILIQDFAIHHKEIDAIE